MKTRTRLTRICQLSLATLCLLPALAQAQAAYSWMSPDVRSAWNLGFKGQGSTITVVDDFSNRSRFSGNLGSGNLYQGHGYWTALEASMIAPEANVVRRHWSSSPIALTPGNLNVINLSYGMYARANIDVNRIGWSGQEQSIIAHAKAETLLSSRQREMMVSRLVEPIAAAMSTI